MTGGAAAGGGLGVSGTAAVGDAWSVAVGATDVAGNIFSGSAENSFHFNRWLTNGQNYITAILIEEHILDTYAGKEVS